MFEMYENETLSASVTAEVKRGIGHMFYVVDRVEMSYQTPEQVPDIFQQVSAH
jgi:transcription-repair coupling factor (superfamily II helicase)